MAEESLERFISAQNNQYDQALEEIRNGKKVGHWMWYIFPQLQGLGHSDMSIHYAIKNLQQAESYLNHPLLGQRLVRITDELLKLKDLSAHDIFGSPDDLKLRSSMTLFSRVGNSPQVFHQVIDKYFKGNSDTRTIDLLESKV